MTTEDRIISEKDGSLTVNVNGGLVTSSPPHIVDSGASVMIKDLTDEEIVDIIQRLTAKWTDEFKNYENDSDEPEENKLRDDVFAILRKAQEK